MPIIMDKDLYEKATQMARKIYGKPSAYRSGYIVKKYKELGGRYKDDNEPKLLKRWFKEDWGDIGGQEYPVYRPFKRISKDTPLTAFEIDPEQAEEQIELKQQIKGTSNLPPFIVGSGINVEDYSNPIVAQKKAFEYLGKDAILHYSTNPSKKYMIYDPNNDKWVHFGTMKPPMEDFTKHQDLERRKRYLARATKIKGNWKENPYSPNNLSINILW